MTRLIWPVFSWLVFSCLVLSHLVASRLICSCLVSTLFNSSCLIWPVFSCLVSSVIILFCLSLFHLFSYLICLLSSIVLSYLFFFLSSRLTWTRLVCSLPVLSVLYRLFSSCLYSSSFISSCFVCLVSSRLVFVSMCVYLGFDDAAVEAVVLLLVQQTELQRSQRGCQKRNTGTTLEKMDPEHLFASCTINQFPSKTDQH